MDSYGALALSYDRLTSDVSYEETLAFLEILMREKHFEPKTVLDLACGTGSLSLLMAKKGYSVLGADQSEDMLAVAYSKSMELEENRPFWIHQSMQRLRLPYEVDCVVCCLDSINYLDKPEDCEKAFRQIFRALRPGGLFLFDVNTPEKLRALDGQIFLDEDDDVFCLWRAEFSEETRLCTYGLDLFRRTGKLWQRSTERHVEYAYSREELTGYLEKAGFSDLTVYGDRAVRPPEPGEQRIYFACRKELAV